MRVGKWHILGPRSHVSTASLVERILSVAMEIWNHECGPFWQISLFVPLGFPCYAYSIRQDTAGYGRIRQDTAGYGRIRQDTAGYGRIRQDTQDTAGYGRIRQDTADTAGYGRIRQDTAGYDRVQNICLFALRKQPFCVHSAFGGISYCSCMPIVTFPADNPLHVHQLFVSKKKKIATCFLSLVVFHPVPACPLCCFCLG